LSPLLFNIALAVLDEHRTAPWTEGGTMSTQYKRRARRRNGLPNWRYVRYADDFVVLLDSSRQAAAEAAREEIASVLAPLGLRLSGAKTRVVSMSEGFRFPRLPHPVAAQERHQAVARLHLHRPAAHQIAEGKDPRPDPQDITAGPRVRADPAEPGHARLGQLLPARGRQEHLQHARQASPGDG
jgi:hypothetical protein